MFRRLPRSLPQDPPVDADLEKLGYFIDEDDQVRMVRSPDQKYQYRINRSDRINDLFKEALNACTRDIIDGRLRGLGLECLRLPLGAGPDDRHVPIYVSNNIQSKKRVLVLFGARNSEPGVLSYRTIGEEGVKIGSVQEMVEAIVAEPMVSPGSEGCGVIIANPGQLIWHRASRQAISYAQYYNLPRQSSVHEAFRIDPVKNRVPGNLDYEEHVHYIFETVMTGMTHPNARFDIIGLEYTGDAAVRYLAANWDKWSDRVNGICLGNPQLRRKELLGGGGEATEFTEFFETRARAYFVAPERVELPLPGGDELGCNRYASGESQYEEAILIRSWRSMLDWFNMISVVSDYAEPKFTMHEDDGTGGSNVQ